MEKTLTEQHEELYRNGFIVIRNCISPALLKETQEFLQGLLTELLGKKTDIKSGIEEATHKYRLFDIQEMLHSRFQGAGLKRQVLLQPELIRFVESVVGPDLAYDRSASITINTGKVTDHLYIKKLHQEIWSGACLHEIRLWAPLYMPENKTGGVAFIPGSHLWGLIPNRNREPFEMPANYEEVVPAVEEGCAILFHTLTLHKTQKNSSDYPRMALATAIRNFQIPDTGNNQFVSWQPFRYSPWAKIQKALGNPYLTPFRTLGGSLNHKVSEANLSDIPRRLYTE